MTTKRIHSNRTAAVAGLLASVLVGFLVGCTNPGSVEVLESRLRDHEDQLANVRTQLEDKEHDLRAAREEAEMLRQQLESGEKKSPIELANGVVRIESIRIHPLLTGPLDTNDDGRDDELVVLIQPRDSRSKSVEAVGAIEVELRQDDDSIKRWKVTADEAGRQLRANKPASGIMLRLPLDQPIPTAGCSIEATMKTANGRRFEASHELGS